MGRKAHKKSELDLLLEQRLRKPQIQTRRQTRPTSSTSRLKRSPVVLVVVTLSCLGVAVWAWGGFPLQNQTSHTSTVAVIDALSMTDPNPGFRDNVTRALSDNGYSVEYYGPRQVTVDLLRNLPLYGYGIVVIRSHTASSQSIVTSQPYTGSQYVYEQLTDKIGRADINTGTAYFSITPGFVRDAMQGDFRGAVVIAMGCASFQGKPEMATAFIGKGASAFIGWDDTVSAGHTDALTQNLILSLAHGESVAEAVGSAGGPDPVYHGQLKYLDASSVSREQTINLLTTIEEWTAVFSILILGPASILLIPRIAGRR